MIRIFTWFLIVSLLTLNMAWAVDACAFSDSTNVGAGVTSTSDLAPDSTGTIPACNYWCPGWTSVVTLPGSSTLLPGILPATFEGGLGADPYFFLPAPPPTHPPTG